MSSRRSRNTRSARSTRREESESGALAEPFHAITRPYSPVDVLTPEDEDRVHALSLKLLSEIGLKFMSEATWPILEANGCRVDRETGITTFPPEVVEHFLSLAPTQFTMKARNPANDLVIGDRTIHFGSASSAPNVVDLDKGRRPGTQVDFEALVKLNQMLGSCAFHSGHPVEPIDTPVNTRHLTSMRSWQTLSDKVTRIYAIGRTRVEDSLTMTAIAHGIDRDKLAEAPRLHSAIAVNSPLVVDEPLIEGAILLARNGQACVVTPVAFAGAMAPITLSGSLIQCNAEAIGVIAFLQMVKAGAPCIYGVLTTPTDMRTGAPAMGTPETVTGTLSNGQMARRYGLPQRLMLGSTSNATDGQAAYETMMSLWAAILCGAHMVYHAHGWMEAGLTTSFEKTILDSEMIGMVGCLKGRIDLSDAEEAFDAIREVGPGGHFLGSGHTMSRYRTAFRETKLSDWRPYEFWEQAGSPDTAQRANTRWKAMLNAYEAPPIDPGIAEAIDDYIGRRTEELGDAEI